MNDAKRVRGKALIERAEISRLLAEMRATITSASDATQEGEAAPELVLVDELDELVRNAKAVPFTDRIRIDALETYELLDPMLP